MVSKSYLDEIENPIDKFIAEAEAAAFSGGGKMAAYLAQTAVGGAQGLLELEARNPFKTKREKENLKEIYGDSQMSDEEMANETIRREREAVRGLPFIGEKITDPEGKIDIGDRLDELRKDFIGEGLEETIVRNPLATAAGVAGTILPFAGAAAVGGVGPVLSGEVFETAIAKKLGQNLARRVGGAATVGAAGGGLSEIPFALSENIEEGRLDPAGFATQTALGAGIGATTFGAGSLALKGVDKLVSIKAALSESRKVSSEIKASNLKKQMQQAENQTLAAEELAQDPGDFALREEGLREQAGEQAEASLENLSPTSKKIYEDTGEPPATPEVEQLRTEMDASKQEALPKLDQNQKNYSNLIDDPEGAALSNELIALNRQTEQVASEMDTKEIKRLEIARKEHEKPEGLVRGAAGAVKRGGAHLFATVQRRLNDVDKSLAPRVNKVFLDTGMESAAYKSEIMPEMETVVKNLEKNNSQVSPRLVEEFKGLTLEEKKLFAKQNVSDVFKAFYLDEDLVNMKVLMDALGEGDTSGLLTKLRPIYDDLIQKQRSVGRDVGYREGYLSSGVKDYRAYLKKTKRFFESDDMKRALADRLSEEKKLLGVKELSKADEANVINKMLSPAGSRQAGGLKNTKSRKRGVNRGKWFEGRKGDRLLDLYSDFSEETFSYIDNANMDYNTRKFFGKTYKTKVSDLEKVMKVLQDDPSLENVQKSIGTLKEAQEMIPSSDLDKLLGISSDPKWRTKYSPEQATQLAINEAKDQAAKLLKLQREGSVEGSIGALVNDISKRRQDLAGQGLNHDEEKFLKEAFQAVFFDARRSPGAVTAFIRDMAYQVGLGDVNNAISQLGDIPITMAVDGIQNLTPALAPNEVGRGLRMMKKVDITQVEEALKDTRFLRKSIATTLKTTGFKATDALGKATKMVSSLNRLKGLASGSDKQVKQLIEELRPMFLYDDKLVKDTILKVRKGDLDSLEGDPDILAVLFNRLAEQQPVVPTAYTMKYLKSPDARLFYAMKNFTLAQLNQVVQNGYGKISNGIKNKSMKEVAEGVSFLGAYTLITTPGNMVRNYAQDRLAGREDAGWSEAYEDAKVQNAFVSRYNLYRGAREGPQVAAKEMALSFPTPLLDHLFTDAFGVVDKYYKGGFDTGEIIRDLETFQAIPGFGKTAYWNWGGGKRRTEKKVLKKLKERYKKGEELTDKEYDRLDELQVIAGARKDKATERKEALAEKEEEKLEDMEDSEGISLQNLGTRIGDIFR